MGLIRRLRDWREKVDGTLTGPALETDSATINGTTDTQTLDADNVSVNGSEIYVQPDTPSGSEGDVWIGKDGV